MKSPGLVGALLVALLMGLAGLSACGTIGPPMPPEDIGLAAKLIEEKEKARKTERKPGEEKPADEVALPPVRPIGTSAGSQADESIGEPQR